MKKIAENFNVKRCTFVILTCVAVIAIILRAPQTIDAKEILEFNRDPKNYNLKLQIVTEDGKVVSEFKTAVANSEEKKMYGLMNLDKLPQDFAMLFPFRKNQVVVMWMKNTRIPLDMLFIDEDDFIVNIAPYAQPYSLDLISSEKEVDRVLEINGGLTVTQGIKVGQRVKY